MSHCNWFPLDNDEILAWVDAHRETLPTTLEELSTLPMAFRRVIVNYVSPTQRTAFWQDHLRSYLVPESGLNEEQRAFVEEMIPALADVFQSASLELGRERMGAIDRRSRELFSRERCAAMFGALGPPEPPEGLPIPPGTRLT